MESALECIQRTIPSDRRGDADLPKDVERYWPDRRDRERQLPGVATRQIAGNALAKRGHQADATALAADHGHQALLGLVNMREVIRRHRHPAKPALFDADAG